MYKIDGKQWVEEWKPKIAASWEREVKMKFPVSEFSELHKAYEELNEVSAVNRKTGQMVKPEKLAKALTKIETVTLENFKDLPNKSSDIAKSLCQQHEKVRRDQKAIYGRLGNYRPEIYLRIYNNSMSSVAIVVKRGDERIPLGSGVLIGKGLILTCNHCVDGYTEKELEVWFDFTRAAGFTPTDSYPVTKFVTRGVKPMPVVQPIPSRPKLDLEPLDFALLEIGANAKGDHAEGKYPPPKLSSHRLHRDDPVYVIGYPQQNPRTVHDNAFVLFPFHATEREFTELTMVVCAETQESPDRTNELQTFLQSYYLTLGGDYENYSVRWKSPTIAADCDTFHGNSGSGAFDRITNTLIGLLIAGEADVPGGRYTAGWRHHEAILPISEILRQLDAGLPKWKEDYKVTVEK